MRLSSEAMKFPSYLACFSGVPAPQMDDRRAPTAVGLAGDGKRSHLRMLRKDRVDRLAQLADALAVNDPELPDVPRLALGEIIGNDTFDIRRPERVQVQHAVNRLLDRLRPLAVAILAAVHAS